MPIDHQDPITKLENALKAMLEAQQRYTSEALQHLAELRETVTREIGLASQHKAPEQTDESGYC